jgi:hypothetical protein
LKNWKKVKKKIYRKKKQEKSDKVIKKYAKEAAYGIFRKIYRTGPEGIDIRTGGSPESGP